MDIRELELKDIVHITSEDKDWNDLYGIVHNIHKEDGTVDIFCLQNASYTYKVGIWNANTVEKVDINNLGKRGYEQVINVLKEAINIKSKEIDNGINILKDIDRRNAILGSTMA